MLRLALGVAAQFVALFLLAPATPASAQDGPNAACAVCHEEIVKKVTGVHAKVGCAGCHQKHEDYPHPEGIKKPECGSCHAQQSADYRQSIHAEQVRKGNAAAPDCGVCHGAAHEVVKTGTADFKKATIDTCGMCHDKIAAQFSASVHGKQVLAGNSRAPVCTDCHGEHNIKAPTNAESRVSKQNVPTTCGSCHSSMGLVPEFRPSLDRVRSFQDSFHGLALRAGNPTVANCSSCHGIHDILPQSDPASSINPKNVAKTCGHCHAGAGERFAVGPVHLAEGKVEAEPVKWIRSFYVLVIPLTLGLMFVHNLGDFLRKLWRMRFGSDRNRIDLRPMALELRMYPAERVQHFLLATSFIVLTWTGFALLYPDQFWAAPLLLWEKQLSLRGVVHRAAAIVFIITAALHILLTLRSKRLRHHWLEMLPKASDVTEAAAMFAYNLGLRRERPQLSAHSYIEKAEYWAVVWGFIVMAVSGVLLWANQWSLRYMPKWVLDIATSVHFYEAVLAAAAIVIWHFYFVIVDPEVYPMDTAWLTGHSVRREKRAEHNMEGAAPSEAAGDD